MDWRGGEVSSSEESAGVMVCVKRGEGRLRDGARGRMCLVLGEVRKGNVDLCYGVSATWYRGKV